MNDEIREQEVEMVTPGGGDCRRSSAAHAPDAARRFGFELPDGRGVTFVRGRFNLRRWRGDVGIGHVSDGGPQKRWRCYQWPLGLINVYGRWGS